MRSIRGPRRAAGRQCDAINRKHSSDRHRAPILAPRFRMNEVGPSTCENETHPIDKLFGRLVARNDLDVAIGFKQSHVPLAFRRRPCGANGWRTTRCQIGVSMCSAHSARWQPSSRTSPVSWEGCRRKRGRPYMPVVFSQCRRQRNRLIPAEPPRSASAARQLTFGHCKFAIAQSVRLGIWSVCSVGRSSHRHEHASAMTPGTCIGSPTKQNIGCAIWSITAPRYAPTSSGSRASSRRILCAIVLRTRSVCGTFFLGYPFPVRVKQTLIGRGRYD